MGTNFYSRFVVSNNSSSCRQRVWKIRRLLQLEIVDFSKNGRLSRFRRRVRIFYKRLNDPLE